MRFVRKAITAVSKGNVYLVHFESKLHHAAHYLGWAKHVKKRLEHHKAGRGARLLAVLNEKGIDYEIVKVWKNEDKNFERRLKNQKNSWRLCPVCLKEKRNAKPQADQVIDKESAAGSDDEILQEIFDENPKAIEDLTEELQQEDERE